ncbi:hypothetical protein [Propionivibrio sp.]|uniref:hypothetical protein n=1 Tax=Propionivibrio sp. TaxID=2212460 RepID=UPI0025F3D7CD|nr:hypothetical protein [Propionivibrio sp.]MBK8746129.1 hypothetical protein [Propionivibrio sp.]
MNKLLITLPLALLAGCASLQNAGTAEYSVRPFVDAEGRAMCCEVSVKNGKEIASLDAHIEKRGSDYTVDLKERGVKAFEGQAISAQALGASLTAAQRVALAAILAPAAVAALPAAGAALAAPGLGAAAVGAVGGAAAAGAFSE